MQTDDGLAARLLANKRFAALDEALLRRLVQEESRKHTGEKEILKAVKNRLHLIHGAYADEGQKKLLQKMQEGKIAGREEQFLSLHASTRERLPIAGELYGYVFSAFGSVQSVLDLGCGLNPLFLPLMKDGIRQYHALDVDRQTAAFLNRYFAEKGLPPGADVLDLAQKTPDLHADLAFVMKLLPVLEQQKKGRGAELLSALQAPMAVVSFPLRSLGGKRKGMEQNYAAFFEGMVTATGYTLLDKRAFAGELVYLIRRG